MPDSERQKSIAKKDFLAGVVLSNRSAAATDGHISYTAGPGRF